jgi:hypothetical protein
MAATPLVRFAAGLRRDATAIQNALELPWATSPVEGPVNRIKTASAPWTAGLGSICCAAVSSWPLAPQPSTQSAGEPELYRERTFWPCAYSHFRADVPAGLTPNAFTSLVAGTDLLIPVAAPNALGAARWMLPGTPVESVRLLASSGASGLARILEMVQQSSGKALLLDTAFTSPPAAALQTMAAKDLAAGRLVEASGGHFFLSMAIRLFRPLRRQSTTPRLSGKQCPGSLRHRSENNSATSRTST